MTATTHVAAALHCPSTATAPAGAAVPGAPTAPAPTTSGAGELGEGAAPAPADRPWSLCFDVHGQPITQGSIRSLGAGRPSVHGNAKRLKPWRVAVKEAALDAMRLCERFDGPVQVRLVFAFDRPAGHYRTGRNATLLRDGAPVAPANRSSGDLDKLQRAIFDALTDGGVWKDDAQVVEVRARKTWAGEDWQTTQTPGVRIEVQAVTG